MEQTISLKNLIFQILFRWRGIIGIALTFGILLGVYQGMQQMQAQSDPEKAEILWKDYEDELFEYNTEKTTLENSLTQMESQYESSATYYEESLLMKIDPYNVYKGSVEVYLDSYFEILPSMTYQNPDAINQLMAAYQSKLEYGDMYGEIAQALGSDSSVKYMKELVSVTYSNYSRAIIFDIKAESLESVEQISEVIVDQVENLHQIILDDLADHAINITKSSINSWIDDGLLTRQENLTFNKVELLLDINTAEKELRDLKEPSEPGSIIIPVIKYFFLGAVVGGILVVGCIAVGILFSNKLEEESFVESELNQLVLGVRPVTRGKSNGIDKMLEKMYNNSVISTEDEFLEYVLASLSQVNRDKLSIHFTGSISSEELTSIFEKLSNKLDKTTVGGYVLQDKVSLEKLEQAEAVVLIEKRNETNINALDREIKYLEKMEKKVLGIVVL